ncbi:MAG TPA: RES family NAD+ phosphorylase [Candidatus Binatia bacterium]|nr:RES family NAD+ phosphorylase [Candidatus Binatia bacterium]
MIPLYRVLRRAFARNPFHGEGAYLYGGRWSSPATRLSYASEHQSLAMLEYFVHLDKDDPPDDLALAVAEVPDDVRGETLQLAQLPANWRDPTAPPLLARFGDDFAKSAERCLLFVPSVLAPRERNCLVNPAHTDFRKIEVHPLEPLSYDPRMFSTSRRRH